MTSECMYSIVIGGSWNKVLVLYTNLVVFTVHSILYFSAKIIILNDNTMMGIELYCIDYCTCTVGILLLFYDACILYTTVNRSGPP